MFLARDSSNHNFPNFCEHRVSIKMYGKHLWRVSQEYQQSKLIGGAIFFSQ